MKEKGATTVDVYPYETAKQEVFLMRNDDMEWFRRHPRRTRNCFIMHCVSGSAKVRRNIDIFDFEKNMEWTLLPDSVFLIQEATDDFRVEYCVCPPPLFDEVSLHLPAAFIELVSQDSPHKLSTDIEIEANRCAFGLMKVIYKDSSNSLRRQIIINVLQSFYLAHYERLKYRIVESRQMVISAGDKIIKKFWQLLLENYQTQHTVKWYARKLCVTERYLSHIFKQYIGTTPKRTIDDFLTLEIKIELRSTHDTIQQIADRLNFCDQSVMGRFFKRQTGMSPMEYKYAQSK